MAALPSGVITLLVTDIEGSVTLWQRDEAAMSEALARHDRLLREVILRHGGHVIKGTGDGIWSAFDEPAAALHAAVAIQEAIRTTSWGALGELRVRIGVHTGRAELRDGEYFGPTPNRVARLIERARGGQIFASEATIRLAGAPALSSYAVRSLGELRLRGLREPLAAFELQTPSGAVSPDADPVGPYALAPAFIPAHPFPTPGQLIGREPDLLVVDAVLKRGQTGHAVLLIGAPAGTGKSTLAGEVVRRAQQRGALCLAGGAYEHAGVIPFGPIRDALADYLLTRPPEELQGELGEAASDLALVVPELAHQLDVSARGAGDLDLARLASAVYVCLRSLAERQPVVMCLEDLHVADDGTLVLIRSLARRAGRLPLVLCATYRNDEVEQGSELARLLAGLTRDGVTSIDLAPLDREQTGQLIANLLEGPASDRLRDSLYAATEGNPLFVEQSVLALREGGQLSRSGRVWRSATDLPLTLPTIVRDVLEQRLRRLSPRCSETVTLAAVLGQSFEYDDLSAALGSPTMLRVVEDLEEATAARVLREVPSGYAFTHALLREAVYRSLSTARRTLLHAQVGEALERLAGPRALERAAELAHHFMLAGADPALRAKALRYGLEAGRHAADLAMQAEALEHLRRACELIDRHGVPVDREEHLRALALRQHAERSLGLWLPLIETCERILELDQSPLRRALAHGSIGHARQRTGETSAAMRAYDCALTEIEGAPPGADVTAARIELLSDKAYLLFLLGRFREQASIGAEILPLACALGAPRPLRFAHNALAISALGRGQVDEALAHFQQFLDQANRSGDRLDQALAHSNLGIQYQYAGELGPARHHLERALALRREAGAEQRDINTIQRLGWVMLGEGDLDAALQKAERARDLASRASDRWLADCCDLLGTIATLRAEWPVAMAHFGEAMRLREHGPHVVGRVETLLGLGTARQHAGNWRGAREAFIDALAVASSIDPSPWLVAARRQLGRNLCLAGDQAGSGLLIEALNLAETMPRTIEYGPTLLAMAEVGAWRHDRQAARAALEHARTLGITAEVRIDVLCALGRLHAADRALDAARDQLAEARTLATRLGAPRSRCVVHRTAAAVAAGTGDREAAIASLEQGLALARASALPYEEMLTLRQLAAVNGLDPARVALALDEANRLSARLTAGLGDAAPQGARSGVVSI